MRALTIDAHGGLEQLRYRDDVAEPSLIDDTSVRVRIKAAALNHLDLFTIGGMPHVTIAPPWIVGADGSGIVESVGSGVRTVSPGDAVLINPGVSCRKCEYCLSGDNPLCLKYAILGEHRLGTLAEYVVVPEPNVARIALPASFDVPAAFPLATLTAWRMLVTRARVKEGDNVMIWGIGGGVALAALQIAKRLGARVWVTSGSPEKLERARALGADETLRHGPGIDIGREVRARTGKRGVDVVIDNVGQETFSQSLGALGRRGRLVTCGGTSGPRLEMDVRRLFWNQWTIMGSTMGSDQEFAAIVAEYEAGRLSAVVDSTFALADGRAAFERMAAGAQFGKIVVRID
ncbi:MAG: putative zinc-type alcohol dehydrogenase-like protein YjmD [Gemmatimonadaceae bacterium]|nr:putative zinc-type alcohol dehydrogenase-like protein YjmD [Gemmatimonadaceae bacterium]